MKFSKEDKPFLLKNYSYKTSSIAANGAARTTRANAKYTIPEGYTPIACTRIATGSTNLVVNYVTCHRTQSASSHIIAVRNCSSEAITNFTTNVAVLFVRSDLVSEEYIAD